MYARSGPYFFSNEESLLSPSAHIQIVPLGHHVFEKLLSNFCKNAHFLVGLLWRTGELAGYICCCCCCCCDVMVRRFPAANAVVVWVMHAGKLLFLTAEPEGKAASVVCLFEAVWTPLSCHWSVHRQTRKWPTMMFWKVWWRRLKPLRCHWGRRLNPMT